MPMRSGSSRRSSSRGRAPYPPANSPRESGARRALAAGRDRPRGARRARPRRLTAADPRVRGALRGPQPGRVPARRRDDPPDPAALRADAAAAADAAGAAARSPSPTLAGRAHYLFRGRGGRQRLHHRVQRRVPSRSSRRSCSSCSAPRHPNGPPGRSSSLALVAAVRRRRGRASPRAPGIGSAVPARVVLGELRQAHPRGRAARADRPAGGDRRPTAWGASWFL